MTIADVRSANRRKVASSNSLYDEPDPVRAIFTHSPPKIALRIVSTAAKFCSEFFDSVDRIFARRVCIGNRSTIDDIAESIESKLDNLKRRPNHQSQPRALAFE
jgi:hypothetical protein